MNTTIPWSTKRASTPSWTWTLWYHGPWSTKIGFYSILNTNTAVIRSMVHKKGHLLHPELQHYSTVVHGPCKGASTPSWSWIHTPTSLKKGFPSIPNMSIMVPWSMAHAKGLLPHLEHKHLTTWTYGQTHWRATTVWEVWTWAHQLQSKLIANCQIPGNIAEREIFSSNTLISPPTSISASSKKTQLEFVCFSNKLHKNIPSVAARLWHHGLQVHCWF